MSASVLVLSKHMSCYLQQERGRKACTNSQSKMLNNKAYNSRLTYNQLLISKRPFKLNLFNRQDDSYLVKEDPCCTVDFNKRECTQAGQDYM